MSPKTRTWQPSALLTPFFISLLTALLGAVLLILPLGQSAEENVGLDLLFILRGARDAPAEAVVIPIEQRAADALGLPNKPERWPRALHARLVARLHAAGADTIVIDSHIKEPRDADGVFAAAMKIRDAAAAQHLEQAATHTRAAALAELRAFIQAASSETWNEVAHNLPREAAMRLTALHDAYGGDPHPYLNFYGPPRTITTLSYSDAL